jgi:hypothetical protein
MTPFLPLVKSASARAPPDPTPPRHARFTVNPTPLSPRETGLRKPPPKGVETGPETGVNPSGCAAKERNYSTGV